MEIKPQIISVYKPVGITSHGVIARVRRATKIQRVGHAGTLDPSAEGVLVIAIGREKTRELSTIVKQEKEYIADVFLGAYSETDDREGEKQVIEVDSQPSQADIEKTLSRFVGIITLVPPVYSAIKIHGKRSYKLARKGVPVELEPRASDIKKVELLSYAWPHLTIKVTTGKGVYIRSIAREIGKTLGCGAYLYSLARTRVGQFSHTEALSLENLDSFFDRQKTGVI